MDLKAENHSYPSHDAFLYLVNILKSFFIFFGSPAVIVERQIVEFGTKLVS